MISYFTQKVLQFQKDPDSQLLRNELIKFCQISIYTYPVSIKIIPPEQAADLLLYVSPRIETLLRTFTYTGIPFENYIKKVTYLQAHSFNKMRRKEARRFVCDQMTHEDIEYFIYTKKVDTGSIMRPHITYADCIGEEDVMWSSETPVSIELKQKVESSAPFKKRLLHLILLCSDKLNSSHISFLANFLDMKEIELAHMITQAIELSDRRISLKENNKRIRDNHFFEKEFLEREKEYLLSIDAHPFYIEKIDQKLENERTYLNKSRAKMKVKPTVVTHSSAGKVTSVPKGTVDSGLQSLFKYLYPLVDEMG